MSSIATILNESKPGHLASMIGAVEKIEQLGHTASDKLRIGVLRNFTAEGMIPLLKFHAYRSGLQPEITIGDYDNVRQEVLNPDSHIYRDKPDLVVLALFLEQLDRKSATNAWDHMATRDALFSLFDDIASRTQALIVINTFVPPLFVENALSTSKSMEDRRLKVRDLNQHIYDYASKHASQFFVVDWERLLCLTGEEKGIDRRFYYLYKSPFKTDFLDLYAREILAMGRALKGKAKKCLVLDCDNTLWGGIIGEDGMKGIQLDPNEYPGKSYYDFQQTVVNLAEKGVVVALCSKNNEQDVWEVLDNHPHSVLKRSHLSAWKINWTNKAENIASLAKDLNLGLDSFVFVDDSDMECSIIKEMLPDVTVLQVPEKLYQYPALLLRDQLFDTLSLSKEDAARTEMYRAEFERKELKDQFTDLDGYLASLEIGADIHRARAAEIPRIAQLTGKTNQFNLTTRRYSESDIQKFVDDSQHAVYGMAARDRFGDLGLIAVMIARKEDDTGIIDTLLMSCRALGRKLEQAFVTECLSELEKCWELKSWKAEYLPTKKNQQVESFWDSFGFTCVEKTDAGKSYTMQVGQKSWTPVPYIHINRE